MSRAELIGNIPLFESLAADDLETLSNRLEEQRIRAGDVIFREGEANSTSLYVIEEGAVGISYGSGPGRVELAMLYPGQYFGELSLFDGGPRSATATAAKESLLLTLDRDDLVDFVSKDPAAALLIMKEMGERLRHTNELMSRLVSKNVNEEEEERLTIGQKIADRVAAFGGSWTFIFIASGMMLLWMGTNIVQLFKFDPFPFILLNLALSSIAALQAPVIMMSQNRQSAKDKLLAENDYRVNLKSEVEIGQILKGQGEIMARLQLLERQMSKKPATSTMNGTSVEVPKTTESRVIG